MAKNLLLAAVAILAMIGALVWFASRNAAPQHEEASSPEREEPAPTPPARREITPEQLAQASSALMPDGYGGVQLGMSLDDLRRLRPRMRRDSSPGARRDDGREVWTEDDPSGAQVIYLVEIGSHRLAQVQFASVVHTGDELRTHFEAMEARYGHPTGLWDCPQGPSTAPLRRFTFRRDIASVVEAVLIYQGNIALTLIIANNDDIAQALQRSQCTPVHDRDAMVAFPIAHDLPGPTTPLLREVPRDH